MQKTQETQETEELGYIDWWEFGPVRDHFICRTVPDRTKKETESGIIVTTQTDIVQDRPFKGQVVAAGPESKYKVGEFLYWQPQSGMDLAMIRTDGEEKFILLHTDSILGRRVKDTRKT